MKEVSVMAPLSRWDPVREALSLRDVMNQLVEQAFLRPGIGSLGAASGHAFGQMNVLEANGRYYCRVILPGVAPDDVELTMRQNTLTLTAKVPDLFPDEVRQQGTYLLQEVGSGEFSRSIAFPKDVQADAIAAHYDQGILTIEIPVAEHAQPKRIAIHAGSSTAQPATTYVEEGTNHQDEPRAATAVGATTNGRG
jgi:HSP20 family protein